MLSEGFAVEKYMELTEAANDAGLALTTRHGCFELRWHSRREIAFESESLRSVACFLDGVRAYRERQKK